MRWSSIFGHHRFYWLHRCRKDPNLFNKLLIVLKTSDLQKSNDHLFNVLKNQLNVGFLFNGGQIAINLIHYRK